MCNCGDTITSNYTMSSNLTCAYSTVGANGLSVFSNVTVDLNGFTIDGNNSNGGTLPLLPYGNNAATSPQYGNYCIRFGTGSAGAILKSSAAGGKITGCRLLLQVANTTSFTLTGANVNLDRAGQFAVQLASPADTGILISHVSITNTYGSGIFSAAAATLDSNDISSNYSYIPNTTGCAIELNSAANVVSNNNIHDNLSIGICNQSTGSTFTGNVFARNKKSFLDPAANTDGWDTSNTQDGFTAYVYNATTGQTYDYSGATIGGVVCGGCSNNVFRNAVVKGAISAHSCSNCTVSNVTIQNPFSTPYGQAMIDIGGGTVSNSTLSGGFGSGTLPCISVGGNPTVTGNNISHCGTGINLIGASATGTVSGNTFAFNRTNISDFTGASGITYSSNSSVYELDIPSNVVNFSDTRALGTAGVAINFALTLNTVTGTACNACTYTVQTYPAETVSSSKIGNSVTGSFTPLQAGTYSLFVTTADGAGSTWKRNYIYLVGATTSATAQYYLAQGQSNVTANGAGVDAQLASPTNPAGLQAAYCSGWWQMSPSIAPPFPLGFLTGLTSSVYYSAQAAGGAIPSFVWERNGVYTGSPVAGDLTFAGVVQAKNAFATGTPNWSGINQTMDAPNSWNATALKLEQDSAGLGYPEVISNLGGNISSFTLTYSYASTAPIIKSLANTSIEVLQSTANTIVVDNPGSSAAQTFTLTGLTASRQYLMKVDGGFGAVASSGTDGSGTFTITVSSGIHTLTVATQPSAFLLADEQ